MDDIYVAMSLHRLLPLTEFSKFTMDVETADKVDFRDPAKMYEDIHKS